MNYLKEQKLDKEMQEHQKLCDEIMAIQGIEPIEAEMEEVWHCPEGYVFKDENINVINATKIVLEKKKKEYPKTYVECYRVLGKYADEIYGYKKEVLYTLQILLVCRDAYWKIAGEEMGLGKPWEPDYTDPDQDRYAIVNFMGNIEKSKWDYAYSITFVFPTSEMRDAFYENFKEVIESCKELL